MTRRDFLKMFGGVITVTPLITMAATGVDQYVNPSGELCAEYPVFINGVLWKKVGFRFEDVRFGKAVYRLNVGNGKRINFTFSPKMASKPEDGLALIANVDKTVRLVGNELREK